MLDVLGNTLAAIAGAAIAEGGSRAYARVWPAVQDKPENNLEEQERKDRKKRKAGGRRGIGYFLASSLNVLAVTLVVVLCKFGMLRQDV